MAATTTDSILDSTKEAIGIVKSFTGFDSQLIDYINTAFSMLHQLGVGPDDGFAIEDNKSTWDEFISGKRVLNMVKTYVHMNVRLMFDPPANSFATTAMKEQMKELEWRINVQVDPDLSTKTAG